jgi:hypothetical protein
MAKDDFISIWYFVGLLLDIYGVLILGSGIYDYINPSATDVHMAYMHAGIWWGAMMVVLGIVYTIKFAPKRASSPSGRTDA